VSDEKDHECTLGGDVIQAIAPPSPDGRVQCVRHTKDHQIEFGCITPLKDGRPIVGTPIRTMPRGDGLLQVVEEAEESSGPANVNSRAYLEGWDRIFGNRAPTGQA